MAFYNRVRDALEEAISTFEQNKQQKSITALNKLNPLLSPLEIC
jgi:flagellin-specific chaperone FliS